MWQQFLKPLPFSNKEIDLLVDLSEGFSGSDIHDVCMRLHRRRMVTRHQPKLHDAFLALQNLAIGEGEDRRFLAKLKNRTAEEIPGILRERDVKRYSYGALSQLLGVSRTTASRWSTEGVATDG